MTRDIQDAEGEGPITDKEFDILVDLMGPDNRPEYNDYGWGDLLKALRKGYELGHEDGGPPEPPVERAYDHLTGGPWCSATLTREARSDDGVFERQMWRCIRKPGHRLDSEPDLLGVDGWTGVHQSASGIGWTDDAPGATPAY